jgi:hypothetical protein
MTSVRGVRLPFLAGLFLICMCSLMLQILETRMLSVISWYYLAFFAISMAMFGMTAGSLLIYFNAGRFTAERMLEHLSWISWGFALAVVGSAVMIISTVILSQTGAAMMAVLWLKTILVILPPYVLAGMAISLALTRSPWPIGLVYGVDLIGAASGCLLVLALMTWVDGVSALFAVGAIAAGASVCFRIALRRSAGADRLQTGWLVVRHPGLLALLLAGLAAGNAAIQPRGLGPVVVKNGLELGAPAAQRWNSFSRIRAAPVAVGNPSMWGPSPFLPPGEIAQMNLTIDGLAGTAMYQFDGDLAKLGFLRYDVTNLAYSIRNQGRSAVIGVGGGRDLLSAHLFGFADVTGVELNPTFIDWLTRRFRDFNHLADIPGTHFNVDEARSWFARTNERFDLIEMSLIDTWAATGAGAYSLSENGLYTVEGWKHFLDALTPNGIYTVSRWYNPANVSETGRVVSLAMTALRAHGVDDPRTHIFLAGTPVLATIIVGAAPLSTSDLSKLHQTTRELGFTEVISPDRDPGTGPLGDVLSARNDSDFDQLTKRYHLDLSAPTDDRPFFFNQLILTDLVSVAMGRLSQQGVLHGNYSAGTTIVVIVALSLALVLATMIVPSLPSLRRTSAGLAALGTLYFALIGLGFMFIEIGIIQRVSIFLGHPLYGLAIGLFSMILSTGVRSLLSERARLDTPTRLLAWAALLVFFVLLLSLWFPMLVRATESMGLAVRALVALAAIVPAGAMMGFGFPTGMRLVNAIDRRPTPWFWAVNGACGVLAASVAVATSIAFSINASLWVGAGCYILLAPVAIALGRMQAAAGRESWLPEDPAKLEMAN